MSSDFTIIHPNEVTCPIIISVPHSGVNFPEGISERIKPEQLEKLDDTDWYVHQLYDFATELGIPVIKANYHRWVVDLNRDPISKPLYNDGRHITAVVPTTDFLGNDIYISKEIEPTKEEIAFRLENYFHPYHKAIEELIKDTKSKFGKALLWDAHSIKRLVPTIRKDNFPDMILGDNDEKTAAAGIIHTALEALESSNYQINHNAPFKGGYITRTFGDPKKKVHTLQLEMSKDLYMNNTETDYDFDKADNVRAVLKKTFEELIEIL